MRKLVIASALALLLASCAAKSPPTTRLKQTPPRPSGAPQSIGRPNNGSLDGGTQISACPGARVVNPDRCWATDEAAWLLVLAIQETQQAFPDTPDVVIGDFSVEHGGPLSPHRSHQSGRDVDVGYYYVDGPARSFRVADAKNLDVERTWFFIETLLATERVEYIFIDYKIQKILYDYARRHGDAELVKSWFQYPRGTTYRRSIIRHVVGHRDHLHIRFRCPEGDSACLP